MVFLLGEELHEVELSSTFRNVAAIDNTIAQCIYHTSSNLSRNFTAVLTRAHANTSCFRSEEHCETS